MTAKKEPKRETSTTQIQLRVEPKRKNAYKAAAKRAGMKLTPWMFSVCDAAAGFEEKAASQ